MEFNVVEGTKGFTEMVVGENDTAIRYESGLLEVFATPAMVALMEKTAHQSIQNQLPEGYITLGTEICVTHLKPTLVGKRVKCISELKDINGKKLEFNVLVYDEQGTIGEGTHKRYIVQARDFMQKAGSAVK